MRTAVLATAFVALAGAGWFEYQNRSRRADRATVETVQAKLASIPTSIGDWSGEDREYDARQMDRTGSFASLHRLYRNPKTNESIAVLLLAGPATDIGSHDPNRCYVGAGYRPVGSATKRSLADGKCSLWSARFDTDTFPASSVQAMWAWSRDGNWTASDNARTEFVLEPVLYKLYVSRRLGPADGDAIDPTESFLTEFFPAVQQRLGTK